MTVYAVLQYKPVHTGPWKVPEINSKYTLKSHTLIVTHNSRHMLQLLLDADFSPHMRIFEDYVDGYPQDIY